MKYTIENIDTTKEYLLFWGHQIAKDNSITKTCFSQWWLSAFVVEGIEYKTAEHWMMAKKAALFGDTETLEKIIACETPQEVKKLGRLVKNYEDEIWLAHRYAIVKEGNYHKFSQNKNLHEFLLSTADSIIVEASPVDAIWGIGLDANHEDAKNPSKWRGLNLLGFALMNKR